MSNKSDTTKERKNEHPSERPNESEKKREGKNGWCIM